jgi:peptide subunit release factor 1 (eRF1)
MDFRHALIDLAKLPSAPTPVVSVYLNTHWGDEQQRERVRIFLKNELTEARRADEASRAAAVDLDWIEQQGALLWSREVAEEARGAALFACEAIGLRQLVTSRVPFDDLFVVDAGPRLRPLAEARDVAPPALLAFVDTESARLLALTPAGLGEEVDVESDVPGHHKQGGSAADRIQRHFHEERALHYERVAQHVIAAVDERGVRHIVLAGDARNTALFRGDLPERVSRYVIGTVPGTRYEPIDAIAGRAAEILTRVDREGEVADVDAALVAAAKRGKAAAGVHATLEGANQDAIYRLYLLKAWTTPGRKCMRCGMLGEGFAWSCPVCGGEARVVELGEAITQRVVVTGGEVEPVQAHEGLARAGGIAADLRHPL